MLKTRDAFNLHLKYVEIFSFGKFLPRNYKLLNF